MDAGGDTNPIGLTLSYIDFYLPSIVIELAAYIADEFAISSSFRATDSISHIVSFVKPEKKFWVWCCSPTNLSLLSINNESDDNIL